MKHHRQQAGTGAVGWGFDKLKRRRLATTVPQIASVSGHSIESTQRILETYIPRNRDLAAAAIARLADFKK